MSNDVHLSEPAADLLATTTAVARPWLRSLVHRHAGAPAGTEVDELIEAAAAGLIADLTRLLATDVDAQSVNPLALFRACTVPITVWLLGQGLTPGHRDPFAVEAFPDDVFGLYPARWDDIDPSLQSPGITWGAWKAMTVMQRRRAEQA